MIPVSNSQLALANFQGFSSNQNILSNDTLDNNKPNHTPPFNFTMPPPPSSTPIQPMFNLDIQHVTIPSDDEIKAAKEAWLKTRAWQTSDQTIPCLSIKYPNEQYKPYLTYKRWRVESPFGKPFKLHLDGLETEKNAHVFNAHFQGYLLENAINKAEKVQLLRFTSSNLSKKQRDDALNNDENQFKFELDKEFEVYITQKNERSSKSKMLFVLPILFKNKIEFTFVLSDTVSILSNINHIHSSTIASAWVDDWKLQTWALINWEDNALIYAKRLFENACTKSIRKLSGEDLKFLHSELEKARNEVKPSNSVSIPKNTSDKIYTKEIFTQWAKWLSMCISTIEEKALQDYWALKPSLDDNSISPHYLVRGFINEEDTVKLLSHSDCEVNSCIVRLPPFKKIANEEHKTKEIILSTKVYNANTKETNIIHRAIPFVRTNANLLLKSLVNTVDEAGQRLITHIYLSENSYLPLNNVRNGKKYLLLNQITPTNRAHSYPNPNTVINVNNDVTHQDKKIKLTINPFNDNNNIDNNNNNNNNNIIDDNDSNNLNNYNLFADEDDNDLN